MVLIFTDMENLTDAALRSIYELMPEDRKRKYDRFRFDKDKKLCALAWLLLLYGLYMKNGTVCRPQRLVFGTNGKPGLPDDSGIFFNLSHCDLGAACVLSDVPVGIDIQDVDTKNLSLLNAVMSEAEIKKIKEDNDEAMAFTRLWACKESYLKCTGEGIHDHLRGLEFPECALGEFYSHSHSFVMHEHDGCAVCVCSDEKRAYELRIIDSQDAERFLCLCRSVLSATN